MDEAKDAPVEIYSLTREELQVLVECQRRRIKQLEWAIEGLGRDLEYAKVGMSEIWLSLQQKIER